MSPEALPVTLTPLCCVNDATALAHNRPPPTTPNNTDSSGGLRLGSPAFWHDLFPQPLRSKSLHTHLPRFDYPIQSLPAIIGDDVRWCDICGEGGGGV
jgi:hypothetical protein